MQMFANSSFMTELRSHLTVNQQLTNKCPHCRTAAALPVPGQLELPMARGQGMGGRTRKTQAFVEISFSQVQGKLQSSPKQAAQRG